jgi:hypothetical protein
MLRIGKRRYRFGFVLEWNEVVMLFYPISRQGTRLGCTSVKAPEPSALPGYGIRAGYGIATSLQRSSRADLVHCCYENW